jgi:hypothetical protein
LGNSNYGTITTLSNLFPLKKYILENIRRRSL